MSWAWRPQAGPQKALVECPLKEIFFGGTRGGGKTDGVLGKWAVKEKRSQPDRRMDRGAFLCVLTLVAVT
jgi:hypothetical protein